MAMARLRTTTSLQIILCCDYCVQSHNTDQSSGGAGFKYLTIQQTGWDDLDTHGQREGKPLLGLHYYVQDLIYKRKAKKVYFLFISYFEIDPHASKHINFSITYQPKPYQKNSTF